MSRDRTFTTQAEVWLWRSAKPDLAAWHFATINPQVSAEIRYEMLGLTRGFGSVPVTAQIGETRWKTSLFPSKEKGGYILPLKAAVRKAEGVIADDVIELTLEL